MRTVYAGRKSLVPGESPPNRKFAVLELEDEVHDCIKDDQIGRHETKSAPFAVRLWPPYPKREESEQRVWRNHQTLQPKRPDRIRRNHCS